MGIKTFVTYLYCCTLAVFIVQAKKQYEKAFKDWEKAQEVHWKTEQDANIPRVDVEKVSCLCL